MKKYFSIILGCLVLASCYGSEREEGKIWGIEPAVLRDVISRGDFSFTDSIDFRKLSDFSGFYPGGLFYLSRILEKRGDREGEILLLREEISSGIYRSEAAEKLYNLLSEAGDWSNLADIMLPSGMEFSGYLTESLFRSGRLSELLDLAGDDFSDIYSLMALISSGRKFEKPLEDFLYRSALPEEAQTLYRFLKEKDLYYSISDNLRQYIQGLAAYYRGDKEEMKAAFSLWKMPEDISTTYPSLYYRLRLPLLQAGLGEIWAERFSREENFGALFTAARLFRAAGRYDRADDFFRNALALGSTGFERDRARWYIMDLYGSNITYLTNLIEEFSPGWSDQSFYNDLLEEYLSAAAGAKRWDLLERVYPYILSYGDREIKAAFTWLRYLSGNSSHEEKVKMIGVLSDTPHLSYYNILGTLLSGEILMFDDSPVAEAPQSDADRFIQGFFDFSLKDEALRYSKGLEEQLNSPSIRKLSLYALESGDYIRSVQLAARLAPGKGLLYSREDLSLLYPGLFYDEIDRYSGEYGFPGEILAGIIRTESAFTPDIISHAGAVGLTQLMPETAFEQARKLGIDDPDLTDPETNIRIGSSYVRWILDRPWNDNLSQMLIAYNAGGGNLRKWKKTMPGWSDELFVESVPYKETRNYVKKVVISSVVYGILYGGDSPGVIVESIYPGFASLKP